MWQYFWDDLYNSRNTWEIVFRDMDIMTLGRGNDCALFVLYCIVLYYLTSFFLNLCRYEGTGRSLSLKLIQQLRQQSTDSQQSTSAENRNTNAARLAAGRYLSVSMCPVCSCHIWLTALYFHPHSSFSPWGFPSRVHSVRSRRRCGEVAEWATLSGLSQHSQAHLWLPPSTDLRPVSFIYFKGLSMTSGLDWTCNTTTKMCF